jgi:hypothetical protein
MSKRQSAIWFGFRLSMALICLCCTLLAAALSISCGKPSEPEALPSPGSLEVGIADALSRIRPDVLIAVAQDFNGYLDDCGCSGDDIGGLARAIAIVKNVGAQDSVLVLAGTTSSDKSGEKQFSAELERIRDDVGVPLLWVEPDQHNLPRLCPGDSATAFTRRMNRFGLSLVTEPGRSVVLRDASGAVIVRSSDLRARGRELALIGIWKSSLPGAGQFVAPLGPLFIAAIRGGGAGDSCGKRASESAAKRSAGDLKMDGCCSGRSTARLQDTSGC